MALPHIGAWGLPDFQISERVGDFFGKSRTAQGGSNLFGGYSSANPGQVQGIQDNPINSITGGIPTPKSGFSSLINNTGSGAPAGSNPSDQGNFTDNVNNALDSGYNDYFSYLDNLAGGLVGQKASQEQVAQNTYDQGFNTLNTQFNQNQTDLNNYQARSLKDLGEYIRQSFQQGNTILGTRGASDSSAANQYAFALTKLGSQERGKVMQDIAQRQERLKTTFDTEVKNLELSKNNQLLQISQWFAEAQNQIGGMRADAQRQKSQEALNYAMQLADQVNQQAANRRSALDTWVLNHANSLKEAQAGLMANAQNVPAFQGFDANIGGGGGNNINFLGNQSEEDRLIL